MRKLYVGKVTGVHGVLGEIKVISDFEAPELVFKKNMNIYIDDECYTINKVRIHQGKYLVLLEGINSLNDLPILREKKIYIDRDSLELDRPYLMQDLINFKVRYDNNDMGVVKEILENKAGYLLKVWKEKYYLIPFNEHFIKEVMIDNKIIVTNDIRGLME